MIYIKECKYIPHSAFNALCAMLNALNLITKAFI